MRYQIFRILPQLSYMITIGSQAKPDGQFRERVSSDIDRAFETFSREKGASHSIAVIRSGYEERGDESIPEISPGGQYLICALTYSNPPGSAESKSDQELEEERQEITRALERVIDPVVNDINIGIILLQDCSVTVIPVYSPKGPDYRPGWIRNHPNRHEWVNR